MGCTPGSSPGRALPPGVPLAFRTGRGQPTLTIQALAFRAAEHIDRFARAGEL